MSTFQTSKDISNPIDMNLQSGLTQEVHQELSASQVLNGKDQARHRAAAPDADLRDCVQIPKESSLVNEYAGWIPIPPGTLPVGPSFGQAMSGHESITRYEYLIP